MSDDGMLDNPALYDGVLGRRTWAYLVDVLLIAAANVAVHVALFMMGVLTIGILMLPAMLLMAFISFVPLAILVWLPITAWLLWSQWRARTSWAAAAGF